MGLTIHYRLRSRARDRRRVREQIEALHEHASKLDLLELGPVQVYRGRGTDSEQVPPDEAARRWFLIQSQAYVGDPQDRRRSYLVRPTEIIGFTTWPAEGSEAANFGLARYPPYLRADGLRIPTRLTGWRWSSFCKTQYASREGPENFLKAHLSVVSLLDEAQRIGILEEVADEGRYWENRDVQALLQAVGQWNERIAALVGRLDDLLPPTLRSQAAIKQFSDYEHLEARGRRFPKRKKRSD